MARFTYFGFNVNAGSPAFTIEEIHSENIPSKFERVKRFDYVSFILRDGEVISHKCRYPLISNRVILPTSPNQLVVPYGSAITPIVDYLISTKPNLNSLTPADEFTLLMLGATLS